jgi:iron complex outermembrane receptor protein
MPKTGGGFFSAVVIASMCGAAIAQSVEDEDMALAYGDKSFVSIATGARVPVARAPAVATVITAEDIRAIGAVDLDEVLETVPGLHVARGTAAGSPVYVMRGMHWDKNPHVLMLVNGIPVTMAFNGNRGDVWGGLPLENVARIEVIRGPGSALYGADAVGGVINIATKTAGDVAGTEAGTRVGSFRTGDAWVQHGGSHGSVDVAGYLRVGVSDGAKLPVARDAQSGLDALMGTHASRAPGVTSYGRDAVDGALDLASGRWRFRVGYKERDGVGSAVGLAGALDPTGDSYSQRVTSDLTYHDPNFSQHWDVSVQASLMRYKEFSRLVLFPAGTNLGGGVFADGMIGNPDKWERHGRIGLSAFYSGVVDHRIRLGMGGVREELDRVRESKNFWPGTFPYTPIGTGSVGDVVDVSGAAPFMQPHKRLVRYWFIQDEWAFAKDWSLTTGLRRDHYSDFGGTTNPRLALSWEAGYNVTVRAMYGTAFRAPSFVELFAINNPVQTGTPTLSPEKMRTTEAAITWQALPSLHVGINLFRYRIRDIIRTVAFVSQNTGSQTGSGAEFEVAWNMVRNLRLSGHYSRQKSTDDATGLDAGLAPHDRLYWRGDWRFSPGWAVNAQINMVGKRQRAPGDSRAALVAYRTLDATVRTDRGRGQWEFAASVRNLFNADAREPSPAGTIPDDIPLPRRSLYVQASYAL